MKPRIISVVVITGVISLAAASCSPVQTLETISTGQTCLKVEEILGDMTTVLIQLAVNPLALPQYAERLRGLSGDLRALSPLDEELNSSVDEVANGVDQILESTDLSNPLNLAGLPAGVATVQGALKQVLDKCEQLIAT